jgi:hypothetical protein
MTQLVGTPETMIKARLALKSFGYAYSGPETLGDGTDVHAAIDRIIDALSEIPPIRRSNRVYIEVCSNDIYACGMAIEGDHWLRRFWLENGFELPSAPPRKMRRFH